MFLVVSKFRKQFLKMVTQGILLWNYFKIWPVIPEQKTFNKLPDDKILDWSKLKQIADDISKCI